MSTSVLVIEGSASAAQLRFQKMSGLAWTWATGQLCDWSTQDEWRARYTQHEKRQTEASMERKQKGEIAVCLH